MVGGLGGNTKIARRLRRDATDVEVKLWKHLRSRQLEGAKFRRQVSIDRFVVDFCCLEAKLVVELDGSQHADNPADAARTQSLEQLGFRVLRFWNHEVNENLDGVLETIRLALISSPHPAS
ncbi:MAG: DUF559 domain-containing protein [Alphaproteobacteria bacterium]